MWSPTKLKSISSNQTSNIFPQGSQYNFNQTLNNTGYSDSKETNVYGISAEIFAYICAIISGTMVTLHIALNKKLTSKDDFNKHIMPYLFWMFTIGLLMSGILMFIFETLTLPTSTDDLLYVLGHSVSYALVFPHFLYATSVVSGHTLSILNSLQTCFMVAAQYSILKHVLPGHHNWQEVCGVFLVIAGSILPPLYDVITKEK